MDYPMPPTLQSPHVHPAPSYIAPRSEPKTPRATPESNQLRAEHKKERNLYESGEYRKGPYQSAATTQHLYAVDAISHDNATSTSSSSSADSQAGPPFFQVSLHESIAPSPLSPAETGPLKACFFTRHHVLSPFPF